MSKVTEKNTKAQILDAYEQAMKTIAELKAGKTTTAEVVKAKEVKAVKEAAKQIVEMNILDASIISKYNNLLKTIKMLEAEIEELYGIKREADSLEALINSYKDKTRELETQYKEKVNSLDKEFRIRQESNKAVYQKEVDECVKKIQELKQDYKEEKEKLDKERAREKEEYTYNLNRERAIENDKWLDEKTAREKELAVRESAVTERELEVDELNKKVVAFEDKVTKLELERQEIYDKGVADGTSKAKKEAETSKEFANRAHKAELERKEDIITSLQATVEDYKSANITLQNKLDEAYARIQSMAIEAAKNSGTRVIESVK